MNSTRLFGSLALVGAMSILVACGSSKSSGPAVTGTLQGQVMDATTGMPIATAGLTMTLVQGTSHRSPSVLMSNNEAGLGTQYAFTGIPVTGGYVDEHGTVVNDAVYDLVVSVPGYQAFQAEFAFDGNYSITSSGVIQDNVYNKIGNIYLFPTGIVAPDYTVTVQYNNTPVQGATVELVQMVGNNQPVTAVQNAAPNFGLTDGFSSDRLMASAGLYPIITAPNTTDPSGQVTFKQAGSLVLGGGYEVVVLPLPAAANGGVPTQLYTGPTWIEGSTNASTVVNLTDAVPGANPAGIYITSISNSQPGSFSDSGTLTITFNTAVVLNNASNTNYAGFAATTNATSAQLDVNPVTAVLSNAGMTLTLTPNWLNGVAPDGTDGNNGLIDYVDYSDGVTGASVSPANQTNQMFMVFTDLVLADGVTHPSGMVDLFPPTP